MLNVPHAQVAAQRKRLEKEKEQLEKNIANSKRQLGDETFLSRAPAHVVESIRTKLAEYEAQLAKSPHGAQRALGMIDFSHPEILDCVRRALEEDIGSGDVTSRGLRAGGPHGAAAASSRASRRSSPGLELLPLIYQLRGGVERAASRKTERRLRGGRARSSLRCAAARARCSNASAWR